MSLFRLSQKLLVMALVSLPVFGVNEDPLKPLCGELAKLVAQKRDDFIVQPLRSGDLIKIRGGSNSFRWYVRNATLARLSIVLDGGLESAYAAIDVNLLDRVEHTPNENFQQLANESTVGGLWSLFELLDGLNVVGRLIASSKVEQYEPIAKYESKFSQELESLLARSPPSLHGQLRRALLSSEFESVRQISEAIEDLEFTLQQIYAIQNLDGIPRYRAMLAAMNDSTLPQQADMAIRRLFEDQISLLQKMNYSSGKVRAIFEDEIADLKSSQHRYSASTAMSVPVISKRAKFYGANLIADLQSFERSETKIREKLKEELSEEESLREFYDTLMHRADAVLPGIQAEFHRMRQIAGSNDLKVVDELKTFLQSSRVTAHDALFELERIAKTDEMRTYLKSLTAKPEP